MHLSENSWYLPQIFISVILVGVIGVQSGTICGNLNMVDSTTDPNFINQAVAETNNERLKHGVPPLVLSNELNKISQNWANQLATKYKTLVHTSSVKEYQGSKCGENLFMSYSGTMAKLKDGTIPIKAWYAEISNYDFAKGISNNGKAIGHFTQNVWKGSQQFGIATALGSDGKNYVVATYFPAGNFVGAYRTNVFPANGIVPPSPPVQPNPPSQPRQPSTPTGQYSQPGLIQRPFPPSPIGMCQFGESPTASTNPGISVCDVMKPKGGENPEQTTPCPWRIFTYRNEIEQLHAQPVTLGSMYSDIFKGYLVAARKLTGHFVNGKEVLGDFIGHFEPQWDAIPVCCNGSISMPNMLESAQPRVRKPNQTLLWTAPKDYVGPFVFVATFWRSVKTYWFDIRSQRINVIVRKPTTTTTPSP